MSFGEIPRRDRIIVALDCAAGEAVKLGKQLSGHAAWVKVGMTLFYEVGPAIIRTFHDMGFEVFVDLKLHDIPHQVLGAASSLAAADADLITVHAAGGPEMMRQAAAGATRGAALHGTTRPLVCAVTVLTSMDDADLAEIGVDRPVAEQVVSLAQLAKEAGLDGVICSPKEATELRGLLGGDAAVITPGVRPAGTATQDQKRITTPLAAFESGASHIVIGRPVTGAADPAAAFDEIAASLERE
ncbi:MAG: orotidine-5'-phosphate decarboxylase [Coriobacteriaceae bacterium]|nr:orotidine-5'-phosphate decarboxylase [Coriobacteriaceae bacterium]